MKALSAVLAAALLIAVYGLSCGRVFAEEEKGDVFAFREGAALQALEEKAEGFPSCFDLRNVDGKSYVTPVKVQNPFGACWSFSVTGAAESSLIADGLADETVDLSEKHIAFFATSHIDDPADPQNGEGRYFRNLTEDDLRTSAYRYETGGDTLYATSLFAAGIGPVREDEKDPETGDSLYSILGYRGAKGDKITRRTAVAYDENGEPSEYARREVWYSEDDDWSIPEKYRNLQSYRFKDSFMLPNPSGMSDDWEYHFDESAVDAIKQQLVEKHRAVSIGFCAESYLPGQDTTGKKYMSSNWAHFTYESNPSNHAVTIVGYDDDYPKENFLEGHQPEGDGAFLIKNSWGSELNDFPNNGFRHWGLLEGLDQVPYDAEAKATSDRATGYFWLSYYDRNLRDPEAFQFEEATEDNDYDIDQMDLVQTNAVGMLGEDEYDDGEYATANVFRCRRTSELKEILVLTTVPGTEVSYEVYMLPDSFNDPKDGVKIAEGKETFEYGGYHRIGLTSSRVLAKGQRYSVVVTDTIEGKTYSPYVSYAADEDKSPYVVRVVNKGESFCLMEGKWQDISEKSVQEDIIGWDGEFLDNFPIKVYLKPVLEGYLTVSSWQDGTPGVFSLFTEEKKTLTSEFRGLQSDMPDDWDPEITWSSGDEKVVRITPKSGDYGEAVIEGVSEGKAYITVDAGEYGTRVVGVNVRKPYVTGFGFDDEDKAYTGKRIRPEIEYVDMEGPDDLTEDYEPVEGVDYKVTYKNNIKPGKAKITVKGIGRFGGSYTETFRIVKAKNKMKAKGKTIRLKAADLRGRKVMIKKTKAFKIKSANGKVTFAKGSMDAKKFSLNRKTGEITVSRGVRKGTYKLTVKVKAAGNKYYRKLTKKVKVTIKVV